MTESATAQVSDSFINNLKRPTKGDLLVIKGRSNVQSVNAGLVELP
jgi:hypothetical protein